MPRILLVDDQVDSCNSLANMLRAVGYLVDCAHSGVAAIDQFNNTGADLVVVNVATPSREGWRVLKWVRTRASGAELPVVVHSAMSEPVWEMAKELGANELWNRGSCSFGAICDSLEHYFSNITPLARAA